MPVAGFLSFRFGPSDGVSVEARKWAGALRSLGFSIRWIAGDGDSLDHRVPGLAVGGPEPTAGEVADAVDGCDVVVVENLLSLPLHPAAAAAVEAARHGLPTIVHHHDLPWQRPRFASSPPPPDDRAWAHIAINRRSASELLARAGIEASTIYNRFAPPDGQVRELREPITAPLVLHPTRAIERKNVPAAVRIAEELGGTYWLLGPAEDGYGPTLDAVLAGATCPVRRGEPSGGAAAAFDECDVVTLPSIWEGFGNATIESALHRRPLVVGRYPVLDELLAFGFRWFDSGDRDLIARIERFLREPETDLLDHNENLARTHFALEQLPDELRSVLERVL